jgi:WD40 repeat protein/tRNA A-37 threonylcarbamoyl transferase component Bud32
VNESQVFHDALKCTTAVERDAYLDEACAGDPGLRADVEALLRAHASDPGFLEQPAGLLGETTSEPPPPSACNEQLGLVVDGREKLREAIGALARPGDAVAGDTRLKGHASATTNMPARTTIPSPPLPDEDGLPQLAGYDVLDLLGRGGMGIVYRARHIGLNRVVALKMLRDRDANADELARFRTEAEVLARLSHPHIVQVYEVGAHDGRPFFALEYVEGGTLDRRLSGTPLPYGEAAQLVETLARAVQAAHEKGVLHRDLKPANVLLDAAGRPKVADFGLARKLDHAGQTQTGAVMGTPSYMAPEQAAGKVKEIGRAADVYALGGVLYECLTGRPPFKAATMLETLRLVLESEPVPVRQFNPGVPLDLETICLKCLHKEQARRYTTTAELADDLHRFQTGEPIRARPASSAERAWKWCRRRPALAGLLVALPLAALLLVITLVVSNANIEATLGRERKALARQQEEKEAADRALEEQEDVSYLQAISLARLEWAGNDVPRAETQLAACIPGPGRRDLRRWEWHYLKRLCDSAIVTVPGGFAVAFSPDGKRFTASSSDGVIRVWDATTGKELAAYRGHRGPACGILFRPNAREILSAACVNRPNDKDAYEPELELFSWDQASGRGSSLCRVPVGDRGDFSFDLNGERFAWSNAELQVGVCEARSGRSVSRMEVNPRHSVVALSGDGERLAVGIDTSGSLAPRGETGAEFDWPFRRLLDEASAPLGKRKNRELVGELKVYDAATGVPSLTLKGHTGRINRVVFSPDGKRVATAGRDATAKVWDLVAGRESATMRGHTGEIRSLAFSTDGRLLASGGDDTTVRIWDAIAGQELLCLRGHSGKVTALTFSPDGGRLLSADDKVVKLWDLSARQDYRVLSERSGRYVYGMAFSPDSALLATACQRGSEVSPAGPDIGEVKLWNTYTWREVTVLCNRHGHVHDVAFSPDGRFLATACGSSVTFKAVDNVRLWDVQTGKEVRAFRGHADSAHAVAFGPRGLLASAGKDGAVRLWDTTTGGEVREFQPGGEVCRVAFSSDGHWLAAANFEEVVTIWDVDSGHELCRILGDNAGGRRSNLHPPNLAFSGDGRHLALPSRNGSVRIWETETGRQALELRGHEDTVRGVAFSPDGRRLVTAGKDQLVKIWDAVSGREILTLRGQGEYAESVVFSPDGKTLVTSDRDGSVLVWDANPFTLARSEERRSQLREERRRRVIPAIVDAQFKTHVLKSEVIDSLRGLADLNEEDRVLAIRLAEAREENPKELNAVAWERVRYFRGTPQEFQHAVRIAQAAHQLAPNEGTFLTTLGVAQFLAKRHEEAVETLLRADKMNAVAHQGSLPVDLAFLAAAQHAAGQKEQARQTLARLKDRMKTPPWSTDKEALDFSRRAERFVNSPEK